jgi:hypothetical protein
VASGGHLLDRRIVAAGSAEGKRALAASALVSRDRQRLRRDARIGQRVERRARVGAQEADRALAGEASMEYRVLGPLEVRDGERSLSLAGEKQRALLALLLLSANRVAAKSQPLRYRSRSASPAQTATASESDAGAEVST